VGAIDVEVLLVHPGDLGFELLVTDGPLGRWTAPRCVIGGRRNLQFLADRLDAELTALLFDVAN
jgi:hypothetical protein